jgi:hypothetical protein
VGGFLIFTTSQNRPLTHPLAPLDQCGAASFGPHRAVATPRVLSASAWGRYFAGGCGGDFRRFGFSVFAGRWTTVTGPSLIALWKSRSSSRRLLTIGTPRLIGGCAASRACAEFAATVTTFEAAAYLELLDGSNRTSPCFRGGDSSRGKIVFSSSDDELESQH